jgi:TonB family protein
MNYYEADDKRRKAWGIVGVVLYVGLCVGVMFISYTIELPEPELGIMVDFGTSDRGSGDVDLAVSEIDARPVSPRQQSRPTEEVLTTDDETAPAVVEEPKPVTAPAKPVEQTAPVREVNRRALFPGRTEGSTSTSQGTAEGAGNQGVEEGGPEGSATEGGAGGVSLEFDLSGRETTEALLRPAYNIEVEGRVVVRITVDREGRVTSATIGQGSTTNRGELVNAALAAARKARFTPSEKDVDTGTITYIFRLER